MANNREKIEAADAILQAGLKDVSVDGLRTSLDLDAVRAERDRLIAEDPNYARRRRRRTSTLDMGNAW